MFYFSVASSVFLSCFSLAATVLYLFSFRTVYQFFYSIFFSYYSQFLNSQDCSLFCHFLFSFYVLLTCFSRTCFIPLSDQYCSFLVIFCSSFSSLFLFLTVILFLQGIVTFSSCFSRTRFSSLVALFSFRDLSSCQFHSMALIFVSCFTLVSLKLCSNFHVENCFCFSLVFVILSCFSVVSRQFYPN